MPLDRTTDAITHFIGLFHIDVESGRMRDWYDAFRNEREDIEYEDIPETKISLKAPYKLKKVDVDSNVKLPVVATASTGELFGNPMSVPFNTTNFTFEGGHSFAQSSLGTGGSAGNSIQTRIELDPHWVVPLPNSIMTVTTQSLYMSDDDYLGFYHDVEFVDPDIYAAELTELADALAGGLSELIEPGLLPSVDQLINAIETTQEMQYSSSGGGYVFVASSAEATGIIVDGVQVEAMPDFLENMPTALKPVEEETDAPPYDGPPEQEEQSHNPYAIEDGHHVRTGENLSANEAFAYSNWVDAGVIGVMGDVVQMDLISQIYILSEHDSGGEIGTESWAVNAAQIIATATTPVEEGTDQDAGQAATQSGEAPSEVSSETSESSVEEDSASSAPLVLPEHWQMTRVEGDVVSMNWIEQHIFATDSDRAEVEFSGYNTMIEMGANTLSNFTTLVELGFHYDLIIVGGSMITINMIEQINVLLDSDTITGSTWVADTIETGGNYLQNSASIEHTGIDTITEMTDQMIANAEALAEGAENINKALATDEIFEGLETLSVLYIEGDLIEFNGIEQHNYVGDADQVHLALDEFVSNTMAEVTVTTGSNALLNDATIQDMGIDSTVMAAGEAYSDALIHQAGLIDDTAMPTGVAMAELSSEAVAAFLANSMIDPQPPTSPEVPDVPSLTPDTGNMDVMQSLLA